MIAKADLKTVQDLSNPNIKQCHHCGNDTFHYKQKISGTGSVFGRYNGEETDNGDMHEGLRYAPTGKFAYCSECKRRVFRFRK